MVPTRLSKFLYRNPFDNASEVVDADRRLPNQPQRHGKMALSRSYIDD